MTEVSLMPALTTQASRPRQGQARADVDVVIIGAGAAGLAAARTLRAAGVRIVILEARGRVGGRIFTYRDPRVPVPIELGAEFVHGLPQASWKLISFRREHSRNASAPPGCRPCCHPAFLCA